LTAIGTIGDQTVKEEISTTGDPAAIRLTADRTKLTANGRDAFNGMGLAIVQSTWNAGTFRITAHSPGLNDASVAGQVNDDSPSEQAQPK
jgi:hypothetical protein